MRSTELPWKEVLLAASRVNLEPRVPQADRFYELGKSRHFFSEGSIEMISLEPVMALGGDGRVAAESAAGGEGRRRSQSSWRRGGHPVAASPCAHIPAAHRRRLPRQVMDILPIRCSED